MKLAILGIIGIVLAAFLLGCQPAEEGADDRAIAGEAVSIPTARQPALLYKLWQAQVVTSTAADASGVNCNTVCSNTGNKLCVGAYLGIEHDVANVGETEEIITEWVPVSCFEERVSNPLRCRCY